MDMKNEWMSEYIKLHLISLKQDAEKLQHLMDSFEGDLGSEEYKYLEIEDIVNTGEINATRHLLSVVTDILQSNRKEDMKTTSLPPHLQRMVDLNMDGADIMHGELKVLMLEAEKQLDLAQEVEMQSGEAMDSMERKYWEGALDTYAELYQLTYDIAFAKNDKVIKDMKERIAND